MPAKTFVEQFVAEVKENPGSAALGLVLLLAILWFTSKSDNSSKKKVLRKKASSGIDRSKYAHLTLTEAEVAKHCTRADGWLIVDNRVFDVTSYIDVHPGGDSILKWLGQDASRPFKGDQHPESTKDVIEEFYIGDLVK